MLKQSLHQKQLQKLSPQQIRLMQLIQLPTTALEQRIKEELQENPALEEGEEEGPEDELEKEEEAEETEEDEDEINIDEYIQDDEIPDYKTTVNNTSPDDERKITPIIYSASFQDTLADQAGLCDFNHRQEKIAEQIIGSIEDDGYLRRPLSQIANDLIFSQNISAEEQEIEEVLHSIQQFDPPGVGARDLKECLLLQIHRKKATSSALKNATAILENYFNDFSYKHYAKIKEELNLTDFELKAAMSEILKLNPKPGNSYADSQKSLQHIIPDFIITNNDGKLELSLNSRNAPEMRISRAYQDMLEHFKKTKEKTRSDKEAIQFVKQKMDAANWFIEALNERQQTLLNTMNAVLQMQYEYFKDGDETKLKPMVLKDIAAKTGYDVSTISRVSNSKYIQAPHGTLLMKFLFAEGIKTDRGEIASSREVKKILQDCIAGENKKEPLSDEQLMKILNEKGYTIARRTIAKYREMINIPVARMRREI